MFRISKVLKLAALLIFVVGCSKQPAQSIQSGGDAQLRPLTQTEALADFREMVGHIRAYYGPLAYKERRFGFKFDDLVAAFETRVQQTKSDTEVFALFAEFVSSFHDGHVGISFPANNTNRDQFSTGVFLVPVADKVLVGGLQSDSLKTRISVGEEVLSIGGKAPFELLPSINKYRAFATSASDRHFIFHALAPHFYMTDLVPTSNTVSVKFRRADGVEHTEDLVWTAVASSGVNATLPLKSFQLPIVEEMQQAAGASLLAMGQVSPFFATDEANRKFQFRVVTASDDFRKKYGLGDNEKPQIYAALYRFGGKTVLLVRSYTFSHSDLSNEKYLAGYKAVLDQWESLADVLVVDETHNGGGSYCEDFSRLFLKAEGSAFVQSFHVDRKWIIDLRSVWAGGTDQSDLRKAYSVMAATIEDAYDNGLTMTEPMPLMGGRNHILPANYTWKKPMLVLADELSGSCADAFPMLIKANGSAKIFGARTMGLGGNVEAMPALTYSRASVRLTRGLFTSFRNDRTYSDSVFIENNGVEPDYPYEHTVADFRAGFVEYVKAFSQKAVEQIP